ncbi:MAG: radical SAM protein [Clostridia bacterium]|nr:radical SAM protein [Clostridia bacterium]
MNDIPSNNISATLNLYDQNESERGCKLCPLECGADRAAVRGLCGVGGFSPMQLARRDPYVSAHIARAARHYYEEPPISGTRGSGAIFFSGCNMACVFCQNYDISQSIKGRLCDESELSEIMLRLESLGSHNINLVTPSPHARLIEKAILRSRSEGLSIPIVYNTNSYEKPDQLKRLEGLIDIYLPDLKYRSTIAAKKYSERGDYFTVASEAILEMNRQVGALDCDTDGIAHRGMIVRHLVLPGSVDEARGVLDWISEMLPSDTHISLMSQYTPMGAPPKPLDRRILKREYDRALSHALSLGFVNIYTQKLSSASSSYTPEFNEYFE